MKTISPLLSTLFGTALVAVQSMAATFPTRGPSTTNDVYLEPMDSGTTFTSILTVGESVNLKPDGITPYRFVGLPDGMGAFDNGDGTFTLLANHEVGSTSGRARAHGGVGAFVSKWIINKTTLQVLQGSDLFTNVYLFNTNTMSYFLGTNVAMNRFCSADLPTLGAFLNAASGLGTPNRIYMNGEEGGADRAFAHIVTGPDAGKTWELPYLGKFPWENSVPSPYAQNKTIVAGLEDGGLSDSQLYFYIGTKQSAGLDIEKAGLGSGSLYGVAIQGLALETAATKSQSRTFTLVNLSAQSPMPLTSIARLNQLSDSNAITAFMRVEDGAWDPANPRDFYFVTTASPTLPTRLWRARFNDIANPENGGVIDMVLDGSEGGFMFDNMAVDEDGNVLITEDPGNQVRLSRVWKYYPANDGLVPLAQAKASLFLTNQTTTTIGTQDEEISGIIDARDILGAGAYLLNVQVHSGASVGGDQELVEGGQFQVMQAGGSGPTIAGDPQSRSTSAGGAAQFSVIPSTGAYVQWYFNGAPIAGATSSTYSVTNASSAHAGTYYAIVANAAGAKISGAATLAVALPSRSPSTTTDSYLEPMDAGTTFASLLTVGESVNLKADGSTPYRMVGLIDGLGAYDNGNGTISLLANHEIVSSAGIARAHGGIGAFVSKWTINKTTLEVTRGSDLFTNVLLFNPNTMAYYLGTNVAMARFCSADLPADTAFFNAASGLGTTSRIFMNGEENANGRAFAHVVTGTNAGTSYELPYLGKLAWENSVASPYAQNKTIVAGLDDDGTSDSQVYFYIGTKRSNGSVIERAGLHGGTLYGLAVSGLALETAATRADRRNFTLVNLTNLISVITATDSQLELVGNSNAVTAFMRVEDGAWDPANPRDFYFVTTASPTLPTRLWRLRFNDIASPESGGVMDMLLDGSEGGFMFDNMAVDEDGNVVITEDPGNQIRLSRIWKYYPTSDGLVPLAQAKPSLFLTNQTATTIGTQDEEISGIIDASDFFGTGSYLLNVQVHRSAGDAELVEGGQFQLLQTKGSSPSILSGPTSLSASTGGSATFAVTATAGSYVQWYFNGAPIAGATSSTYSIPSVSANQAGTYYAIVANGAGAQVSGIATLATTSIVMYPGLSVAGPVGTRYQVQSTASLTPPVVWQDVAIVFLTSSPAVYIDPAPVGSQQSKFFRAIPVP